MRETQLQYSEPKCNLHNAGWLAGWWLLRILACARGSRVSTLLRWRAQRAPQPWWPAWFTSISSKGSCVCTYKYQPPTDNPLSELQRSPPEPACCLGFYHIYILYFFSRACQRCIFKAFPSLRERLADFLQGGLWAMVCPGQAPPDFLLCVQIWWTLCQVGYLLTYKVGNASGASHNDVNTENQHVLLKISNSLLWSEWSPG